MNRLYLIRHKSNLIPINNYVNYYRRVSTLSDKYNIKDIERNATAYDKNNKRLFPDIEKKFNDKSFNSILPPPNVTGNLHLGHALMITVLDVICRWKHLNGYNVELIPGIDHAGIATQVVVEQQFQKELGLTRFEVGRSAFLERIWKWKNEKGSNIKESIIQLGAIFNWEKEYFTMDDRQCAAVSEAFIILFDANLIYRRNYLVNWSCSLKSTISDIEVENVKIDGPTMIRVPGYQNDILFGEIYNIRYKIINENDEIIVSTTRPETLFGDTAVAVHPSDERYSHLREKNTLLWHPFRNESIPLIFDESVDPALGTGAVKITPAHSKTDYEMAKRHDLPIIQVIDENGLISSEFDGFANLPRFIAREKILNELANKNLFVSKASHSLMLPICSRSKDVIEFLMKPQWFLDCKQMSEIAIEAVNDGRLKFDPSNFENQWKTWLGKSMDWCLSRQLWWGHPVPAYHCKYKDQTKWFAAHNEEAARDKAAIDFNLATETDKAKIIIKQDDDVLDTWFSSGILPFSLSGWPNTTKMNNYPLDLLVSGHDILFFWIARMVLLSTQIMNDVPFRKVLLHGIICDDQGKKMSKSLGNVVTPDQVINGNSLNEMKESLSHLNADGIISDQELKNALKKKELAFPKGIPHCGVDALRFTLCNSDVREHFIEFNVYQCEKNYRFLNKIWNATKFTLMNCDRFSVNAISNPIIDRNDLSGIDRWILSRLANTLNETSQSLDNLNVGCANLWRTFFYENLCDVYIEATKNNFQQNHLIQSKIQCEILKICLTIGLRHMAIFTPFIANELLNYLPHQMSFMHKQWIDQPLETEMLNILEICSEIRGIKSVQQILKKHGPKTYLFSTNTSMIDSLNKFQDVMNTLTFSAGTTIHPTSIDQFEHHDKLILQSIVNESCTFGISTDIDVQLIDVHERSKRKLRRLEKELQEMNDKISTEKYKKKSKPHQIANDLSKINEIDTKMKAVKEIMRKYSNTKQNQNEFI